MKLRIALIVGIVMAMVGGFSYSVDALQHNLNTPIQMDSIFSTVSLKALTAHASIRINSDTEFTSANGVIGGTGVKSDPYIIEGWAIDAKGGWAGIYIGNTSSYVIIRNCLIYNATNTTSLTYGYGSGIALYFAQNIKIENVTSINNVRGVYFYGSYSRYNILANSTLDRNSYGIYSRFRPNNNTIYNNTISNSTYGMYIELGAAYNTIDNNRITSFSYYGIYMVGASYPIYNNTISRNTISSSGNRGIYMFGENYNNSVLYNYIEGTTYAVYITNGPHDNLFENNTLETNGDGFYLDNSASTSTGAIYSNVFSGNKIYNSTSEAIFTNGLYGDIHDNRFTGNTIINPGYYGIYFYDSYSNRIDNNTIKNASSYGIRFYYYADRNIVDSNLITRSGSYAIHIYGSNYNRLYYNALYYNHGSGSVYSNLSVQAYDAATNYWNTSSGFGNYWYDWANNNDTNDANGDGIVDWAYIIDGGTAKDHYPLKTPSAYAPVVPEFNGVMLIIALLLITAGVHRKKGTDFF